MRLDLDKAPKSAIAEHVHEQSMPHEIDWQGMKAIDRARWKREGKSEKDFTFKSANRNSIVTAVSNKAPFGMPLFEFGVGLDTTLWGDCLWVQCASSR